MEVTLLCLVAAFVLVGIVFAAASVRIVREDQRLTVYRLGRSLGDKGPGVVLLIPLIDRGVIKEPGGTEKIPQKGLVGETRTTVFTDGKVSLAGQEWDAVSQSPIAEGQRVRVVRIILEVEKE